MTCNTCNSSYRFFYTVLILDILVHLLGIVLLINGLIKQNWFYLTPGVVILSFFGISDIFCCCLYFAQRNAPEQPPPPPPPIVIATISDRLGAREEPSFIVQDDTTMIVTSVIVKWHERKV